MLRSSRRAHWDLSSNAFAEAHRRRVASGLPLFDLIQSNPTVVGLEADGKAVLDALAMPAALQYEPAPLGLARAREAVAAWYRQQGLSVHSEQVVLTASSSEAYAYLLKLLCDPGDSILVPAPSYPLFDHLARLEGVAVLRYPLRSFDAWRIDMAALRSALQPTTRAIFVVSPNNPTGSYLHRDERAGIESLAREYDLAVVWDEVFGEYIWNDTPDRVRCAALDATVPTFTLGGLSKSAGMPQMKLGWILVGGDPTGEAMARLEMIADTYLSVSAPIQHGAAVALACGSTMSRCIAERVRANLRTVERIFHEGLPLSALAVDAGWYVCLRVPAVMTDEQWATLLVERDGVVIHPGSYFEFDEAGVLVAGLIAPTQVFEEGLGRLMNRVVALCA